MKILIATITLLTTVISGRAYAAAYVCNTNHFGEYTVDVEARTAYLTTYVKGRPDSNDVEVTDIKVYRCPDCFDVRFAPNSLGTVLTLTIRGVEGELLTWSPGWTGNTLLEKARCSKK